MAKNSVKRVLFYSAGGVLTAVFIFLTAHYFDLGKTVDGLKSLLFKHSFVLLFMTFAYFLSFVLKAAAWKIYLNSRARFSSCLQSILLSLAVNHISPIKIGDAFRIVLLSQKERHIRTDTVAHSVLVLRSMDMAFLICISLIGLLHAKNTLSFSIPSPLILAMAALAVLAVYVLSRFFPSFFKRHFTMMRDAVATKRAIPIIFLTGLSWVLEGAVIFGVALSIGNPLSATVAVWVNSITVGGQVFQIAPGGIATYETVMSLALGAIGLPPDKAYLAAVVSHGYKFAFSYAAGAFLLVFIPAKNLRHIKNLVRNGGVKQ